jgi:rod shape-determining protein MreD
VKTTSVLLTLAVSLLLQMVLARYTVGGRWTVDLVLVGVVYIALAWGPTAGILAGTLGGLAQDALSAGTLGMYGLTKTLVGFGAGVVGGQFDVTRIGPRLLVVGAGTVLQWTLLLGLQLAIGQRWPGLRPIALLGELVLNAGAAFVAYQTSETLPGALRRRRSGRRPGLARREW